MREQTPSQVGLGSSFSSGAQAVTHHLSVIIIVLSLNSGAVSQCKAGKATYEALSSMDSC